MRGPSHFGKTSIMDMETPRAGPRLAGASAGAQGAGPDRRLAGGARTRRRLRLARAPAGKPARKNHPGLRALAAAAERQRRLHRNKAERPAGIGCHRSASAGLQLTQTCLTGRACALEQGRQATLIADDQFKTPNKS